MMALGRPWHFYGKVKFAFQAFICEEFMEFVEDLAAKVSKYSWVNEYMNNFLQYRSRSFFDL